MRREDIVAVYNQGPDAVVALVNSLCARIEDLEARLNGLEGRLNKDSHNSSKPPSSDSFTRKTKSLREATGRKKGGQPGHPGHTLKMSEHPDEIVPCEPQVCEYCAASLSQAPAAFYSARQVFDIPPFRMKVTEYRASTKECPCCGMLNRGEFPKHIQAPVQYGPCLEAIALYLMNYQLLPVDRSAELLGDVLGQPVCVATLLSCQRRCYERLKPIDEQIKRAIVHAPVAHFDETGFYINKKRQWLHSASTPTLTYYVAHPKRGSAATSEIGILPHFGGTAVHDEYESYFSYPCLHGTCNAHHLRELTFIEEEFHQGWATSLKTLLCQIKLSVEKAKAQGKERLSRSTLWKFKQQYHHLLEEGFRMNPLRERDIGDIGVAHRGRQKQSVPKNLLDRLKKHAKETLRFMVDFQVPFDNNLAERDLRMMKVQQKISGCFRTPEGADRFCRIRSYISTAKKQNVNVLHALQLVFLGSPFVPRVHT